MDRSEKFWDRIAQNFDRQNNQDDQYDPSYVRTITNYLGSSDIVLDFACGTATFSGLIAADVKKIHAIDISSKMLEIARRKAVESDIKNIDFMHATLFDERLETESFNAILAFNILHLLEETPMVVQRICSLLRPGGHFISDTPCLGEKRSLFAIITSLISRIGVLPYVKDFRIAELKGAILNANTIDSVSCS